MRCKHCGEEVEKSFSHYCSVKDAWLDDFTSFAISASIAAMTGSFLLGGLMGGDFGGAIMGDLMDGDLFD